MRRTCAFLALFATAAYAFPSGPVFYHDDPLAAEPETQDASDAVSRDLSLAWDILSNLFTRSRTRTPIRALDVNTADEVMDSSWFTNRAGTRRLTPDDVERGPGSGVGPAAGPWTIVSGKSDGIMPGFVALDSAGVRWFIKFDPPDYPELATGAEVVSTKLLWALGYYVPDNHVAVLRPANLRIDRKATIKDADGRKRPLTTPDVNRLLSQGARRDDGSYRVVASRALEGKPLGPFLYSGTRSDDPNDVVPHQHRRSLRGLRVFAAWLNHVDAKAINTLDTLVTENGRRRIRHHLLDFASTLGSAGTGPRDYHEGFEYLYEGQSTLRAALSGGLLVPSWRRVGYEAPESVGRLEAASFDPRSWKPRTPNLAFLHATRDDLFWAARKLAALDRSLIVAAVRTARYTDRAAEKYLVDTLIRRRQRILAAYLQAVTPIVDPGLSADGVLSFGNIAETMDVAARPQGYETAWHLFDNASGASSPLGVVRSIRPVIAAPAALPTRQGAFVRIDVSAVGSRVPEGSDPVQVYFRRTACAWILVGLDRGISVVAAN